MITQNTPLQQTIIQLKPYSLGYRVFVGTEAIGSIEVYPACLADIVPEGVTLKEDVYVIENQPYARLDAAAAAVVAKWLLEATNH